MSDRARTHSPGGIYYALLSGSGGRRIFLAKQDRENFSIILAAALKRYAAEVHAYCWSDCEVRMMIRISEAPLGRIIQTIAAQHARRVHSRVRQSGHLFKHPYRAVLLEAPEKIIEAARHIHLTPLAFIPPSDPAEYTWSSHRAYLGIEQPPPWLSTSLILQSLTPDRALQRVACRDLLQFPEESALQSVQSREERFLQVPAQCNEIGVGTGFSGPDRPRGLHEARCQHP